MSSTLPPPPPTVDGADTSPDLFLSYNNLDRDAVMVVRQLLEERRVRTFLDRANLVPGMPWPDALEDALGSVRGVAVFIGKNGFGVWQKREVFFALDRQANEERVARRFPVIPVILPGAELDKTSGLLLLNTFIDLRDGIDDKAKLHTLARIVRPEAVAGVTTAPEQKIVCPYRGLYAFREQDAQLFFGRDVFARELLEKVKQHGLVAVVGPSGSGKSSVVQAGLMPLLRRERPPADTWEVVSFTPGKSPFRNLAAALMPMLEPASTASERIIKTDELGAHLAKPDVTAEPTFKEALKSLEDTNRLLLVVDQFEELFTLSPENERRMFVEKLLAVTSVLPVTVALTLRADFYGQAIGLSRDLSDRIQKGLVNLGPMNEDELRECIEKPAAKVGLDFQADLVDDILRDIKAQPGSLPLLEFALTELFERRDGRLLTHKAYADIGGIQGAISKRANEKYDALGDQKEAAMRALTRLVRVASAADEGSDTRQRVRFSDFDAASQAVVRSFTDARLLVTNRQTILDEQTNKATNVEVVEVAHEALIRGWQPLRERLDKDREFLLWRQRLAFWLNEWLRAKKDDANLLPPGLPLEEARRWGAERRRDLSDAEREFIDQSTRRKTKTVWLKRAAVMLGVVVLLAGVGQYLWLSSETNAIRTMSSAAPSLVRLSEDETFAEWFRVLTLAEPPIVSGWFNQLALPPEARSLATARQIKDPEKRATALLASARALHELRKQNEARATIDEAYKAMLEIPVDDSRISSSAKVIRGLATFKAAEALIDIGEIEEGKKRALEAVSTMVSRELAVRNDTGITLYAILRKLANKGNIDDELALFNAMPDPALRAGYYSLVGAHLLKAGRTEQAVSLAGEALRLANSTTNTSQRVQRLATAAAIFSKAGRPEETRNICNQILGILRQVSASEKSSIMLDSLRELVTIENSAEARKTIEEMTSGNVASISSDFMANSVGRLARDGNMNQAFAVVSLIHTYPDRFTALSRIASAAAQQGRMDVARRAAEESEQTAFRANEEALRRGSSRSNSMPSVVALTFADAGEIGKAIEMVRQIEDHEGRVKALTRIAGKLMKAQKPSDARQLVDEAVTGAGQITDENERATSFIAIAEAFAAIGALDEAARAANQALTAAREITEDDETRAEVLSAGAIAFAKSRSFPLAIETANQSSGSDHKLKAYTAIMLEYARQLDPELDKLLKPEEVAE